MIAWIGTGSLTAAAVLAVLQIALGFTTWAPLVAQRRRYASRLALTHSACVTLGFFTLMWAFVTDNFSLAYVAANSNSQLPIYYKIAALWGAHEGSILLWIEISCLWMTAFACGYRNGGHASFGRILATLATVNLAFISFLLLTSTPFAASTVVSAEGRDLNPMLQDFGMTIHPILLYAGYVGMSLPFAFAIDVLLAGKPDAAWTRLARPWTLFAWSMLTLGLLSGSFWAYYELGWGGWWFWDAVENAALMPWLVSTALLHAMFAHQRRGTFHSWCLLLALLAFFLSILGTFLVRSGIVSSVHAFAHDARRGMYLLGMFGIALGVGGLLFCLNVAKTVTREPRYRLRSLETALLLNFVLLLAATGTVLVGTLYPLIAELSGMGKISVGPPYFETTLLPILIPLLVLMGAAPHLPWQSFSLRELWRRVGKIILAVCAVGAALVLLMPVTPLSFAGLMCAAWIVLATCVSFRRRLADMPRGQSWHRHARLLPRSYWGMVIAHLGLGVFVLGVTMTKSESTSADLLLAVGDGAQAGDYTFYLADLQNIRGANFTAIQALFEVSYRGKVITQMLPERRLYHSRQVYMTEAAIDRGLIRDLYISLGQQANDEEWHVRIQYKPFVNWIWGGCLLMAFGGLLAAIKMPVRSGSAGTSSQADLGAAEAT